MPKYSEHKWLYKLVLIGNSLWSDLWSEFQVKIGRENSCAQYGMVAVSDIQAGETLFQIPRHLLISPETCAIKHYLAKGKC